MLKLHRQLSLVVRALSLCAPRARPASGYVDAKLRAAAAKRRAQSAGGGRSQPPPRASKPPPPPPKPPQPSSGAVLLRPEPVLSNRAAFRAVPVDPRVAARLAELHCCTSASSAGRIAARKRAQGDARQLTRRYPLYGEVPAEVARVVGVLGPGPTRTRFLAAATSASSLPPPALPEVAFAGRSNVGKSSLINALTLSACARQSDKPGKTQSLNFYRAGGEAGAALALVDLPGYGFAFAKQERVEAWNALLDDYLAGRGATLKRVLLVLDARHGLKAADREMLAFLSASHVRFQVVLNKTDEVLPPDLARRVSLISSELAALKGAHAAVHCCSTLTGAGVAALASELFKLAAPAAPGAAVAVLPSERRVPLPRQSALIEAGETPLRRRAPGRAAAEGEGDAAAARTGRPLSRG